MKKSFDEFIDSLIETNRDLAFYCDFDKIKSSVDKVRVQLNILNSLIGSDDLRASIETIWEMIPNAFRLLPNLIAVRNHKREDNPIIDENNEISYISDKLNSVDGVCEFIEKTGLAKIFREQTIKSIPDYVFGIETGLDTNARKNRSGKIMESLIFKIFISNYIVFEPQVSSFNFPKVAEKLGVDEKKFDFAIKTKKKTYLIEVNFYNSSGSKLNEVARAYERISPIINSIEGFEFVWITDGKGWLDAKTKLKEAYGIIDKVYNLSNINEFIDIVKEDNL